MGETEGVESQANSGEKPELGTSSQLRLCSLPSRSVGMSVLIVIKVFFCDKNAVGKSNLRETNEGFLGSFTGDNTQLSTLSLLFASVTSH